MATSRSRFQKTILDFHHAYGRHDLPWRRTRDPYKILVSEIMLQQTQVDRVVPKYRNFIKEFPNVQALARASQSHVLRMWQGLGYNRRALYLHRSAKEILTDHKGKFPKEVIKLEQLPGIGQYTARAISTFAWGNREVFIETNIRRVYIHFFFARRRNVHDKEILDVVEKTLPAKDIREWYFALMDYGALSLKKIPNPNRKSKHYVRQTRFEGSTRYARAKLLSWFLVQKKVKNEKIEAFFKKDAAMAFHQVNDILKLLEQDGFIRYQDGFWFLV